MHEVISTLNPHIFKLFLYYKVRTYRMNRFYLYYQIQTDNLSRPIGVEALIHWVHPERGLVFPSEFIPLAEDTGLIFPIGQWVLEMACIQLKIWQGNEWSRDLTLSVNVSAKQFHQVYFAAHVQTVVERFSVNPFRLKLELTESMLLGDISATIATML